ncbi:YggT family protein [Paratractidigestivibacter sp.]|uniref:YggT family protein n=1 Tax=Paratractidigestivibacter sp. TaxID=2847316 RepID=UPI002ABD736C|nr:YggT family protein [Paratractidigestivibacter sp.]
MNAYSIYTLVVRLFSVYEFLIVVWCLMSWVPRGTGKGGLDAFRDALGMLVCPYLNLFRRFIPPFSGIDFSPIVAIFALQLIERFLFSIIF